MKQLESYKGKGTAQAFHLQAQRWPDGVVPYKFDENLSKFFVNSEYISIVMQLKLQSYMYVLSSLIICYSY